MSTQPEEAKSSSNSASAPNSTQKKQRKSGCKKQVDAFSAEKQSFLQEKYKDMEGACDWFQRKKQEVEQSQKKANLSAAQYGGVPLHHQWKPPRVDPEKFQTNPLPDPKSPLQEISGADEPSFPRKQVGSKRRSLSDGSNSEIMAPPRKRVLFEGEALLLSSTDQISKPSQKKEVKVAFDSQILDEKKLQEYLDLCDFIMRETHNAQCNGVWLKGSMGGYVEKAMKLLHAHNYNFNLAKFHILFPAVMAVPEQKEDVLAALTEQELENIISDAILDLRGCKSQEAEEAIQTIRTDMRSNRLTVEQLTSYQQMLKKLRVGMPDDVEQEHQKSKEFSKTIKKKCGPQTGGGPSALISSEKKMKMQELLKLQDEASQYLIVTAEMQQLQEHVKRATQWVEKAEAVKNAVCQVKQLQNLQQEARSIPVNFEGLLDDLRRRCSDSQSLVEKIHAQFIKVNKTRTQVNQELQQNSSSKDKKKIVEMQKKEKKQKEQLFKDLLREADALMITSNDIQKLKDHLEEVEDWKRRAEMFLNDDREQKAHKEYFQMLIKETLLFKFEVDLTEELQARFEFFEWLDRVEALWLRMNFQTKDFEEEKREKISPKVSLLDLQTLMQEGEQKGFSEMQIEVVQRIGDVCIRANKFEQELRKTLREVKDSTHKDKKQRISVDKLLDLQKEAQELRVWLSETEDLAQILGEVAAYEAKCQEVLHGASLLNDDAMAREQALRMLNDVLELEQQVSRLGVQNKTFKAFRQFIKPLLRWIKFARSLTKTYLKSVSKEFSQSELLQKQDYDSDSSSSDACEEDMVIDQGQGRGWNQIPENDYDMLMLVLTQCNDEYRILRNTVDYKILQEIQERVENWKERLTLLESEEPKAENVVEALEKLSSEHLPLPVDLQQRVQKRLRRERWLKRYKEFVNSDRVKIKQIETLAKDSNHADIQEDPNSKELAEKVKMQLSQCREWLQVHANADQNSQEDIQKLLEMGNELKINLVEYVELRSFHQDVVGWHEVSKKMLNSIRNAQYNYEFLKNHLEAGQNYDIDDKDMRILKELTEYCAHWKFMARKILKSRELAKLQVQQQVEEVKNTIQEEEKLNIVRDHTQSAQSEDLTHNQHTLSRTAQPIYYDNKKYCICRRGDDGLAFMIECDSCKEWFHGDCVGISKQLSSKINQYICIGCSRVYYDFDPWNKQQQMTFQQNQSEEKNLIDNFHLDAFTSQRRVGVDILKQLLEEAQTVIPIYLEEMNELYQIEEQINCWAQKVLTYQENPPFDFIDEDDFPDTVKNIQVQKKGDHDKVINDLMKLYLESESFPVEHNGSEILILLIKQRKWFIETYRVLTSLSQQNKINKAQQKKTMKNLLMQASELELEFQPNLVQMFQDLQFQLQALSNQQMTLQGNMMKQSIATENMARWKGMKQKAKEMNENYMETPVIAALNNLFQNNRINYQNGLNLQKKIESGEIQILTEYDENQFAVFKDMLEGFMCWLNDVTEAYNRDDQKRGTGNEFLELMRDGRKQFQVMKNPEMKQFLHKFDNYSKWDRDVDHQLQEVDLILSGQKVHDSKGLQHRIGMTKNCIRFYNESIPFFSDKIQSLEKALYDIELFAMNHMEFVDAQFRQENQVGQMNSMLPQEESVNFDEMIGKDNMKRQNNDGTLDIFK